MYFFHHVNYNLKKNKNGYLEVDVGSEDGLDGSLVSAGGGALHRRGGSRCVLDEDIFGSARHSVASVVHTHNLESAPDDLIAETSKELGHAAGALCLEDELGVLVSGVATGDPGDRGGIRGQAVPGVLHFRINSQLQQMKSK